MFYFHVFMFLILSYIILYILYLIISYILFYYMTTTDDGDGRTGRTDGQRTTTTDDGDGRTGRRTDGGRRRRRTRRTTDVLMILKMFGWCFKDVLEMFWWCFMDVLVIWDHPHGGKTHEESFVDTLRPPKHRFRWVFPGFMIIFWYFSKNIFRILQYT